MNIFSLSALLITQSFALPTPLSQLMKLKSPLENSPKQIIVAVIDTGVDVKHPYLKKYIYNSSGDGFADSFHGWNFSSNSANVNDTNGHGTHIAGLIVQNAGLYRSQVKILPIKYYDERNTQAQNLRYTIEAIRYAVKMGASIINYSAGGFIPSPPEREIIRWAGLQGVLVIAAAGNESVDTDKVGFYPASYDLKNVVSVAAVNKQGRILASSNYGAQSVQFAAPGERLLSTLPNNSWGLMTGTSQATAVATGKISQIYARLLREGITDRTVLIARALAELQKESRSLPQLVTKTRYAKEIDAVEM